MKIFTMVPGENWVLDRIVEEYAQTTKHQLSQVQDCDVILLFAPYIWNNIPKQFLINKKFVLYLHHIAPKKINIEEFIERDKYVDQYIVPNRYTKAFVEEHSNKPVEQICYWINPALWTENSRNIIRESLEMACREGKLDHTLRDNTHLQSAFIISSFQRDTEGAGIPSGIFLPKLEKGPDILIETIENIRKERDDIVVLLSGWRRNYVIQELEKRNIQYVYVMRPVLPVINALYDATSLYISASRYEGGPQSIIECGIKKIPIIATNCGIVPDILHPDCVFEIDDIMKRYVVPTHEHINFAFENTLSVMIDNQVAKIDNVLEKII